MTYQMPDDRKQLFITRAKRQWHKDGEVEIDDTAAVTELEPGNGAYVQAWVWVSDPEAGEK